jgi:hypothetical protein
MLLRIRWAGRFIGAVGLTEYSKFYNPLGRNICSADSTFVLIRTILVAHAFQYTFWCSRVVIG